MLHFAVPNIFFQLTLEYVTDSCTKLCSGLILQKHEFKVFFSLDGTFSKLSLLAQIGLLNSFVIFHYVIFCYIFRYFIFCYILSVNFFSKYCYNQKQSSGGVMRKVFFLKKFCKIHKYTLVVKSLFWRNCRSTGSKFFKRETPKQMFS